MKSGNIFTIQSYNSFYDLRSSENMYGEQKLMCQNTVFFFGMKVLYEHT